MSLSAINNETVYYSPEITNDFGKANKFTCIGCKGEMIFHRNLANVKIQHFVHKVVCPFETEPETAEHIEAKKWCYDNIIATKKYKPDSIMVGNQKPDVLFELNGKQIAVECQCSKISFEKWEQRTKDYASKGIYVLWIFGKKYFPNQDVSKWNGQEKRVSVVEKRLHYLNYGRVYYLDLHDNDEDLMIFPTHFESVFRPGPCDDCWWENNIPNWDGECDDRCWVYEKGLEGLSGRELKSIKQINLGPGLDNYCLCPIENDGYNLIRFYDKKWWD